MSCLPWYPQQPQQPDAEVGQPDAERQSCVLTSAYSCLALKNHPTFGVEKRRVEIGMTAFLRAFEGRVRNLKPNSIARFSIFWQLTWFYLFSWFSPRNQISEILSTELNFFDKFRGPLCFFFQVHIHIFFSKNSVPPEIQRNKKLKQL